MKPRLRRMFGYWYCGIPGRACYWGLSPIGAWNYWNFAELFLT